MILYKPQKYLSTFKFQQLFYYYVCCGLEPLTDQLLEKKVHVQAEALFTILLHLVIAVRIKIYKSKKIGIQNPENVIGNNYRINIGKDLAINFIFAFWLGGMAFLQNRISKTLDLSPEFRCAFNNYVFAFQYCGPCFTCLLISWSYYVRHSPLRKKIRTEAGGWMNRQKNVCKRQWFVILFLNCCKQLIKKSNFLHQSRCQ